MSSIDHGTSTKGHRYWLSGIRLKFGDKLFGGASGCTGRRHESLGSSSHRLTEHPQHLHKHTHTNTQKHTLYLKPNLSLGVVMLLVVHVVGWLWCHGRRKKKKGGGGEMFKFPCKLKKSVFVWVYPFTPTYVTLFMVPFLSWYQAASSSGPSICHPSVSLSLS